MTVVVDTSALAAVVFGEPDSPLYRTALLASVGSLELSAASAVEAAIVIESRQGSDGAADLRRLYELVSITITPVDSSQSELAVRAWRRFGKGRHPAGLNLGDCFSYALTKSTGGALLYKGDGFSQTDVVSAL